MKNIHKAVIASLTGLLVATKLATLHAPQKVTIHTHVQRGSYFTPEAFTLAEKFLDSNMKGYDFQFRHDSREDVERQATNHLDTFRLIEIDTAEQNQKKKEKIAELFEKERRDLEQMIKNAEAKGEQGAELATQGRELIQFMDQAKETIYDSVDSTSFLIAGEAEPETGTAYLIESPILSLAKRSYEMAKSGYELQRSFNEINELMARRIGKDTKRPADRAGNDLKEAEERMRRSHENLTKAAAGTIVHEIGHLFGLWHTHQYTNDPYEDITRNGMPNVMSYQEAGEGEFGFAFEPSQINQMRDYLSGGKTYQDMKSGGFSLREYFDSQAQEHGWEDRDALPN